MRWKRRVGFKGKRPEWAPKRARPWAGSEGVERFEVSEGFEGSEGVEGFEGTSKRMVRVLPGLMKRRGMETSWR